MNWLSPKTALQMIGRMDCRLADLLSHIGGRGAPSILNDLLDASGKLAPYASCDGCGSLFEGKAGHSGYCSLLCWAEDHGETPGGSG